MDESNLLFDTSGASGGQIRNLRVGSKYIPDSTALCFTCIPSRRKHGVRSDISVPPRGKMLHKSPNQILTSSGEILIPDDSRIEKRKIYIDEERREWILQPRCCNSQTDRLICYDDPTIPDSLGSSEILVLKMTDDPEDAISVTVVGKSYNYRDRDKSSLCAHFCADQLPMCLYCRSRMTTIPIPKTTII